MALWSRAAQVLEERFDVTDQQTKKIFQALDASNHEDSSLRSIGRPHSACDYIYISYITLYHYIIIYLISSKIFFKLIFHTVS